MPRDELRSTLDLIVESPTAYTWFGTFREVCGFLDGFESAPTVAHFGRPFSERLATKTGLGRNVLYTAQIARVVNWRVLTDAFTDDLIAENLQCLQMLHRELSAFLLGGPRARPSAGPPAAFADRASELVAILRRHPGAVSGFETYFDVSAIVLGFLYGSGRDDLRRAIAGNDLVLPPMDEANAVRLEIRSLPADALAVRTQLLLDRLIQVASTA